MMICVEMYFNKESTAELVLLAYIRNEYKTSKKKSKLKISN